MKRGKIKREPVNPKGLPLAVITAHGVVIGLGYTETTGDGSYSRVIANPIRADFGDPQIDREYAEIVRRYNAHPDLLAACRALVNRYGPASGYEGEQADELRRAAVAIAKAITPIT